MASRSSLLVLARSGMWSDFMKSSRNGAEQPSMPDGGCEPNPGPGGYGAVLLHPKQRAEASGGLWQSAETCCQCRDEVVCRHENDNQRIAQAAGGVARGFLRTE